MNTVSTTNVLLQTVKFFAGKCGRKPSTGNSFLKLEDDGYMLLEDGGRIVIDT